MYIIYIIYTIITIPILYISLNMVQVLDNELSDYNNYLSMVAMVTYL